MFKFLKALLLCLTFTHPLYAQTAERGNASDQDIAVLQLVASLNGFYDIRVDGKWGPQTSSALTKLSEKFELPLNAPKMLDALKSRKSRQVYFFKSKNYLEEIKKLAAYDFLDPDGAKIRNVFTDGMSICGEINAKNGFGGYIGYQPFLLGVSPPPRIVFLDEIRKQNHQKTLTQLLDDKIARSALQSAGREYASTWSRTRIKTFEDHDDIYSRASLLSECFVSVEAVSEPQKEMMLFFEMMFGK